MICTNMLSMQSHSESSFNSVRSVELFHSHIDVIEIEIWRLHINTLLASFHRLIAPSDVKALPIISSR